MLTSLLIMNNTRLIKRSINVFITNVLFKFHSHTLIYSKINHLGEEMKTERKKKFQEKKHVVT